MHSQIVLRRVFRVALLCAALILPGSAAWAQIMDSIEINRVGKDAEITIHFSTQVQYLRHGPLKPGKLLRVFIRSDTPDSELTQQTLKSPETDLVPRFSVTYPELTNGMAITFAQETSWEVRQGVDRRSIVIKVPALLGAKDVVAEMRAVAQAEQESFEAPAEPPKERVKPPASMPAIGTAPTPSVATAAPLPPVAPSPGQPSPAAVATPAPSVPPSPTSSTVASAIPPVETPSAPVLTGEQVETMAKGFLEDARKAIAEKDLPRAVNRLNRTLGLPTNSQTEPAQVLIGEVREMTGEIAKARAEYELYLKAFPTGPAVPRVKERLAQLPQTAPRQSSAKALPAEPGPAEWSVYGSVSQYWYKGNSHIEVDTPPAPGKLQFTTDVLQDGTDQNSLISNVDLNGRRRDGVTDTRIVVRDSDTRNFLTRQKSSNRLYSAYIEQQNRRAGYMVRAGRQNPTGGGVLERFDGLAAGYNVNDRWRVNGVMGIPVQFVSQQDKKSFYGVSVDMQPQPEHVGLSTYYIQEHMDGVVNRSAIGLETRYFDMNTTMFGMLDYDIAYKDLNIAMLQGNYRTEAGTNYYTYFDHRKSPSLGLNNAMTAFTDNRYLSSVKDALADLGLTALRTDAKARTATSDMLTVGVTHPYSARWLFGTDYSASSISGIEAAGTAAAEAGTGIQHVISVQAIGNGLWAENDVGVVNGSFIKTTNYTGESLGLNYVFLYGDSWRLDGNLRYYAQHANDGQRQKRWTPSFKIGYRWTQVTLEAEFGAEDVTESGPKPGRSTRQYFFLGYRWDFR
jgi:hypothetical protein